MCVYARVWEPPYRQKGKQMSKYDMYGKFHLDLHSKEIKIKKLNI